MTDPLYVVSGFGVGLLVGMTGVGGGSLMTPLLILLFGIHPATAVGTDLLYASATKSVGTLVHGLNHTVDWRIVRRENMDGIKVYFGNIGWLLVRASGTENLLRVYCETSNQQTTQRVLDAVAKLVEGL